MPRLKPFDLGALSNPALNDKIIEIAEREARELANLGIGMLGEWARRRLSRALPPRASTGSRQNGQSAPQPDAAPAATPYQVLGIAPEVSNEEVEKAFRRRVMGCHPDKGGSDEELRRVLEAIRQIRVERKP